MNKIYDAALDSFDERNYNYWVLLWNINIDSLPEFVLNFDWDIQNQYTTWYPMWCVYYSNSMHDNYLNFRDWIKERSFWWDLCDKSTTRSPKTWDYLINWVKLLLRLKYIKWYFQISTLEETLATLAEWNCISTWSNRIDFWKTESLKDKYAIGNKWPGHAFHIIWYNRTAEYIDEWNHRIPPYCLIVKDSSNWFNNWFFYIRFSDFDNLLFYTKVFFTNNKDLITNYKKMVLKNIKNESAKLAFLLWIWNWLDWDKEVSREDSSTMAFRVLDWILSWNITKEKIEKAREELKDLLD